MMLAKLICWWKGAHDYGRAQWKICDGITGLPISDEKIKVCHRCSHIVPVTPRPRRAKGETK